MSKLINKEEMVEYINYSSISSIIYDSLSRKSLKNILNNFNIIEINNHSTEYNIKKLLRDIKMDILLNDKDYLVKKSSLFVFDLNISKEDYFGDNSITHIMRSLKNDNENNKLLFIKRYYNRFDEYTSRFGNISILNKLALYQSDFVGSLKDDKIWEVKNRYS